MTFDWATFALQLVNVLVLLAILRHFLFRPVAEIIARRRADTQAALDAAAAAKAEAETATVRARAEADASAAARADVLKRAAEEAEAQRARLVEKARTEAAKIVEEGRAALAREEAANAARTVAQIRDVAAAVAGRALAAQPSGPEGYAARLAEALSAIDDQGRSALLKGGNLRLVASGDLPESVLDKAREALATYGATVSVSTDPSLIAGLELHSDSGVLHNSLAHDLDLINKAMHDDRPSA